MNEKQENNIIHTMLGLRQGALASINQKWNDVVTAVLNTGGKGELTLKLTIEPSRRLPGGLIVKVQARQDCKVKVPELETGSSVFFISDGLLTKDDPTRDELFQDELKETRNG